MTTTAYRKLTQDELMAEARARFGPDVAHWAFRCPSCGDVATVQDFKHAGAPPGFAGQECIGSYTTGRGCIWTAYGLIQGPWEVVVSSGDGRPEKSIWGFPLADAPAPVGVTR